MDNENLTSKITKQVPARRIAKEGVKARAQSGLGRVRPVNPGSRVDPSQRPDLCPGVCESGFQTFSRLQSPRSRFGDANALCLN